MQHHQRFHSLDGLRGFAAIAVMLFHCSGDFMPGGYLAVDFFFCLSGFVIALSYGAKLRDGMAPAQFFQLRLARLYPMMFVGGLLAMALHGGGANILLLVPAMQGNALFPTNPPFWSLLAELAINMVFAIGLCRLRSRTVLVVLVISGLVLATAMLSGPWPRELGSNWQTVVPGMARTTFSFTAGMLLCHLWQQRSAIRRRSHLALALPAALLALMYFGPAARVWWDLAAIMVLMPAIVWLGVISEMPGQALWKRLGDLSYPLYCIHMPILFFWSDDPVERLMLAALLIPASLLLDIGFDRHARAWLARLVSRRSARLQAPAIVSG